MKYSNDNRQQFWALKYIKDFGLKSICLFLILIITNTSVSLANKMESPIYPVSEAILPGAYQMQQYLPFLANKRVAIVANQASIVGEQHLVDTLLSRHVNIVKVFSPEHGFRGNNDAGASVNDTVDSLSNLPIVSLYGNNKKPKPTDLDSVDVIIFDLQDVGVRFYTYISTLHYIMEAAAEKNIPVILLDRPNPNANIVDGPVKKPGFESFISMHPVPVLYGMTIGEYGQMINGEYWLKDSVQCDLTVIEVLNYNHKRKYSLPIPPSPNLRTDNAIMLYPSLCFFEGTVVSVGRGTDLPFELYGHPSFPDVGFAFIPSSKIGASNPVLKDQFCYGVDLTEINHRFKRLRLDYLMHARDILFPILGEKWIDRPRFFNLLAGNDELLKQINACASESEIRESWKDDLKAFKLVRAKYLIYD